MESVRSGGCGRVIRATAVAPVDMCTTETPCAAYMRAAADAKVDPPTAIVNASAAAHYGDILISRSGAFYRDLADGTVQSLSDPIDIGAGKYRVILFVEIGEYLILHSDGQPTGEGNPTMHKVAAVLARRFEDDPATRADRLKDRVRAELVEALEHATFSTLPTYDEAAIDSALADGVIVAVSVTGAGHQVYALTEARDRAAILHALADGPSVLANHPHEAVEAAHRDGAIRAWGPSATGRTVYALPAPLAGETTTGSGDVTVRIAYDVRGFVGTITEAHDATAAAFPWLAGARAFRRELEAAGQLSTDEIDAAVRAHAEDLYRKTIDPARAAS